MHNYTMKKIGGFVKDNYCPEKMDHTDLNELYTWSKIMNSLLEADKNYHVIVAMEEGKNNADMEWDEFILRFRKLYHDSDEATRDVMKNAIEEFLK